MEIIAFSSPESHLGRQLKEKEIEEAEPQEAEAPVIDEKIALEKERLQNLIHGAICKPYRSEGEGFLKSELGTVDYLIDLNKGFARVAGMERTGS